MRRELTREELIEFCSNGTDTDGRPLVHAGFKKIIDSDETLRKERDALLGALKATQTIADTNARQVKDTQQKLDEALERVKKLEARMERYEEPIENE